MRIPQHLRDLPRDRVGRPIPYINVYGARDVIDRVSIRYCPAAGEVGVFYADDPAGEPDFTQQSMQRQRECMAFGRCQVCHRDVPWPSRKIVISPPTVQVITLQRREVAAIHEPWLCPDCADFAVKHCPALIRRHRDEDLTVVPVTSPDSCGLVVSRGWIDGPLRRTTKRRPVAMWIKILLPQDQIKVAVK